MKTNVFCFLPRHATFIRTDLFVHFLSLDYIIMSGMCFQAFHEQFYLKGRSSHWVAWCLNYGAEKVKVKNEELRKKIINICVKAKD